MTCGDRKVWQNFQKSRNIMQLIVAITGAIQGKSRQCLYNKLGLEKL